MNARNFFTKKNFSQKISHLAKPQPQPVSGCLYFLFYKKNWKIIFENGDLKKWWTSKIVDIVEPDRMMKHQISSFRIGNLIIFWPFWMSFCKKTISFIVRFHFHDDQSGILPQEFPELFNYICMYSGCDASFDDGSRSILFSHWCRAMTWQFSIL